MISYGRFNYQCIDDGEDNMKSHTLVLENTFQDEGKLVCTDCDYARVVRLNMAGGIDEIGKLISAGDGNASHGWSTPGLSLRVGING